MQDVAALKWCTGPSGRDRHALAQPVVQQNPEHAPQLPQSPVLACRMAASCSSPPTQRTCPWRPSRCMRSARQPCCPSPRPWQRSWGTPASASTASPQVRSGALIHGLEQVMHRDVSVGMERQRRMALSTSMLVQRPAVSTSVARLAARSTRATATVVVVLGCALSYLVTEYFVRTLKP